MPQAIDSSVVQSRGCVGQIRSAMPKFHRPMDVMIETPRVIIKMRIVVTLPLW